MMQRQLTENQETLAVASICDMSLFSKKNLTKAKGLFDKNKDRIAPAVTKATAAIDKKTGGKYSDKLKKVEDAAAKLADEPGEPDESPEAPEA